MSFDYNIIIIRPSTPPTDRHDHLLPSQSIHMLHYEYYFAGFCCHCLLVIIVRLSFHYYNTQRVLSFSSSNNTTRQPPHLFSHFHPPFRTLCLSETRSTTQRSPPVLPPPSTRGRMNCCCCFYLLAIYSSPEQTKKVEGLLLFLQWGWDGYNTGGGGLNDCWGKWVHNVPWLHLYLYSQQQQPLHYQAVPITSKRGAGAVERMKMEYNSKHLPLIGLLFSLIPPRRSLRFAPLPFTLSLAMWMVCPWRHEESGGEDACLSKL